MSWLPLVYGPDQIIAIHFSWVPLILLFNQCRKSRMPLHVLFSEHQAINTAHPSYSNFIGFRYLNASNTKLPACVTTQSLVPPPLTFQNYCSCTALHALSALHQTHAYSNSDASTAKLMAFALSLTSVLTSGTTSPQTSYTLLLSFPSKTDSRYFSSLSISTEQHCPSPQQCVWYLCARTCVCVFVCVRL